MQTRHFCARCGSPLPSDAPEGLCPQCLLKAVLGGSEAAGGAFSGNEETVIASSAGATSGHPPECEIANRKSQIESPKVHYFGDYELIEEIARGGMGVVYKARQVSLNRLVAVKLILAGQLAGKAEVQRFRTEAEAAANLQHPNIVAIHEVGIHENQHYFSMDFVNGQNLAGLLQGGLMPARRAAELLKVMAGAIHYAHQRGILHRDLKPQNVLIDERGQPRITDFGLAKQMTRESGLTQSGTVMGSPSYMPPEQAAGRMDQIGPPSDVYSLGAILYELLTSQAPFQSETPLATLRKVVEEAPVDPTRLNTQVPADLETICLKCLEKDPQRRYASALALAEDLNRFLKQEPILARPISATRRVLHWLRRRPWSLAAVATLLTMGSLGVIYWLWQENQYLRFVQSHPGHAGHAGPGPRLDRAMQFFHASQIVLFSGMVLWNLYFHKSGRLRWGGAKLTMPAPAMPPIVPVSRWLCGVCLLSATAQCGVGALLLLKSIDALVWEHAVGRAESLMFVGFVLFFTGSFFGWQIIRDRLAWASGLPLARPAAPAQPRPLSLPKQIVALTLLFATIAVPCYVLNQESRRLLLFSFASGWMLAVVIGICPIIRWINLRRIIVFLAMAGPWTLATTLHLNLGIHHIFAWLGGLVIAAIPAHLAFRNLNARSSSITKPPSNFSELP